MNNEDRTLKQIRDDMKIITTNKLNMSQSKLLFMGIIYEIVLRRDLFPMNCDLKAFINKIFIKRFNDKIPFKEYLYSSRTLLASRLQKNIYLDLQYNQIIEIVQEIYNIFPVDKPKKSVNSKNINANLELTQWMNFIREKDERK
ncbi:hypothetical protein [Clostridium tyrobutyricum]|uniref:hypothetical protein n=1 Tax=Clostridium tyrobutyricum TaxID=1519 RepID=UPI00057E31C5|nr:hypothetical protein [Clostridium tyrobutyricum]